LRFSSWSKWQAVRRSEGRIGKLLERVFKLVLVANLSDLELTIATASREHNQPALAIELFQTAVLGGVAKRYKGYS
jgi:hypothetical protein